MSKLPKRINDTLSFPFPFLLTFLQSRNYQPYRNILTLFSHNDRFRLVVTWADSCILWKSLSQWENQNWSGNQMAMMISWLYTMHSKYVCMSRALGGNNNNGSWHILYPISYISKQCLRYTDANKCYVNLRDYHRWGHGNLFCLLAVYCLLAVVDFCRWLFCIRSGFINIYFHIQIYLIYYKRTLTDPESIHYRFPYMQKNYLYVYISAWDTTVSDNLYLYYSQ